MKPELKSTQELSRLLQQAHILLRAQLKTKLGETDRTAVSHGPEAGTKVCGATDCDSAVAAQSQLTLMKTMLVSPLQQLTQDLVPVLWHWVMVKATHK